MGEQVRHMLQALAHPVVRSNCWVAAVTPGWTGSSLMPARSSSRQQQTCVYRCGRGPSPHDPCFRGNGGRGPGILLCRGDSATIYALHRNGNVAVPWLLRRPAVYPLDLHVDEPGVVAQCRTRRVSCGEHVHVSLVRGNSIR